MSERHHYADDFSVVLDYRSEKRLRASVLKQHQDGSVFIIFDRIVTNLFIISYF